MVDLHNVDWNNRNYTLPCGLGQQTVTLRGGKWQAPAGPWEGAIDGIGVDYVDLDRDGRPEALVTIPCSVGAGTVAEDVLAFKATPYGAQRAGQTIFGALRRPLPSSGEIVLSTPYYAPSDPRCCASQQDLTTYRFKNGGFKTLTTKRVPAA